MEAEGKREEVKDQSVNRTELKRGWGEKRGNHDDHCEDDAFLYG